MSTNITRRSLFGMVSTAAVAGAMPSLFAPQSAQAQLGQSNPLTTAQDPASIDRAFTFQNLMMDAYASGATIRLSQSYSDAALQATGFTYDNAVAIHAYLSRGQQDDLARAKILGLGLLHAQATNFPIADGRFAQGYFVNAPDSSGAFITPAAFPFFFYGSSVGDQAWAGMALAQLYRRTRDQQYLAGALLVANWIVTNTFNTQGPGGYSYGTIIDQFNQSQPSPNGKSTEGNLDTYAFFTMLQTLTDGGHANNGMTWAALAQHAFQFCFAMFNPQGPFFYTGTLPDEITINTEPIPEDCQTWSYLAFLDTRSRGTIDWALANLQTTDTASSTNSNLTGSQTVSGLTFSTASLTTPTNDPHAVWLEGTAHTAAALTARVLRGSDPISSLFKDISQAVQLLKDCEHAQQVLGGGQTAGGKVIPTGLGVVASSSVLDTGFGFTYGQSLHIGATGWYLIAGLAVAQQPRPTMPPLQNPAILAGLWEASNEQGGIVGIQIILNTRGQDVETIEFGLFERTGSEFGDLPFNYFGPQGRGADTCHWDGHHLTIDFVPPQSKVKLTPERAAMSLVTPVHVDLIWNESVGTWTGLFQYESSEGHVVLRRPTPVVPNVADSLVGSWTSRDGLVNRCLHVVRESDGKLNGWVDSIPAPERIVCPSKMPPTPIMGHYGDMTKVELARDGKINTEFGAYSGMCCSQAFEARISLDGTLLEGGYLTGPNQTAVPATWRRVAGQSCSAENAKSPAP